MKTSTALMCVRKDFAPGVAKLRQRMRERALDEATAAAWPRVWMEALEGRVMLDATAATVDLDKSFGQAGYAVAPLPWRGGGSWMDALAMAPGGKIYALAGVEGPDYWAGQYALARFNADGTPDQNFGR